MKKYQIKIQQVQLYNVPMIRKKLPVFMHESFNMLKSNHDKLKKKGLSIETYHNDDDGYTRFQFGIRHGYLTLTAYGALYINAQKVFLKLLEKQAGYDLSNRVKLTENYRLHFLPRMQTYMIKEMLINPQTNDKLLHAANKDERKKILSQYLFNNFIRLFDLVGYRHDTQMKRIDPLILDFKRYRGYEKTFARAKALAKYDIHFKTDLYLPHLAALGGATAMGYGKLYWE